MSGRARLPGGETFIDVGTSSREELDALPEFLREKVQASQEYGARFLGGSEHESVVGEFDPNDVPF